MSKLINLISIGAGEMHPESIEDYQKFGGFEALKKAMGMQPARIVEEVKTAKLLGRGGAAFPIGIKWEHLLHIEGSPKYIVCNADEGEPGTFKDRFVLRQIPLRMIEGIIIAGYVFNSPQAYIYLRGEYRDLNKILKNIIAKAKAAGFLGKNILGSGYSLEIDIVSGAGAYVCGENSALLNSTEGKVGRPRIKPPHLAEVGLFQMPTLVNNVESFAAIPEIVIMGGQKYLELGHPDSGGSKLVCLSGHCARRGTYEIPLGKSTLRDVIYDEELGGGMAGGRKLKFFHLGGQSGPIGHPDQLDTVYSYSDLRAAGLSVGSGAVVVMDDSVSILEYLQSVNEFFIHESCGKCVPCREGNRQIKKILDRLLIPGAADREDLANLRRLIDTMTAASFCGLGQTAAVAINTAWKHFKSEFEANVAKA
ncbi:MAG: NADH-quinone oxidoreductase subunit F [Desulfovibrionaceae bacterium]|nr:NADH-quinone oxidoreductase subunit F [Desulfovibrionaceae bacterium]